MDVRVSTDRPTYKQTKKSQLHVQLLCCVYVIVYVTPLDVQQLQPVVNVTVEFCAYRVVNNVSVDCAISTHERRQRKRSMSSSSVITDVTIRFRSNNQVFDYISNEYFNEQLAGALDTGRDLPLSRSELTTPRSRQVILRVSC